MKYLILSCIFTFTAMALAAEPPKNRITMEKAISIAQKAQAGEIKSKELEYEKDRWVYSFDIQSTDKVIHEILVDAKSGKIISKTTETPKQEKAEEPQGSY